MKYFIIMPVVFFIANDLTFCLMRRALLSSVLPAMLLLAPAIVQAKPDILLTPTGLTSSELAVIINDDDVLSVAVAQYYQKARHIPAANMVHVRFASGSHVISKVDFLKLKAEVDRQTPANAQAYAVTWTDPYRVDCMSITSALAFGFDKRYCSTQCGVTKPSPYFNSATLFPAKKFKMRPAMMLAGKNFEQVKLLIDRGVSADQTFPTGTGYLLNTPDTARSVRAINFAQTAKDLKGVFPIEVLKASEISNRTDVLFYFTGLVQVPQLETLQFQPGALADHLTSLGGMLTDSSQMSALRWLEAGATASYGTVVEPCSHLQKFPFPGVAMFYYAKGSSAIEAYWKSVAWPGEGVFVGEPLSKPFAPLLTEIAPEQYELSIFVPRKSMLYVESAKTRSGPFNPVAQQELHRGLNVQRFSVSDSSEGFLRLRW